MLTLSKRFRILQCHCVYFLCAWLELSLIYAIYSTTVGSIAVSNEFRIAITFFFILKLWIFGNWYSSVLRKCHAWIIRGYVLVHARKEIRTLSMFLEKNYANSFKYVKTERSLNIICLDPDLSQSCWAKYFNPFFDFMQIVSNIQRTRYSQYLLNVNQCKLTMIEPLNLENKPFVNSVSFKATAHAPNF